MQASITLNELGMFILFITVFAAGVYAIVALKSLHAAAREATEILHRLRSDLSGSIPHVAETTENAVEISRELKKRVFEAGKTIETISRDTTDTVLRVNATADHVASYVLVFGEIAKAILELFPKGNRS
jgi:methyl-accepting chemotaxis protein